MLYLQRISFQITDNPKKPPVIIVLLFSLFWGLYGSTRFFLGTEFRSTWGGGGCHIWTVSWQNQQNGMCTQQSRKDPIRLGIHPVWSVFAVRSMGSQGPKLSYCGQRRLWSESSLGARHFVGFVMSRLFCHYLSWTDSAKPSTNYRLYPPRKG